LFTTLLVILSVSVLVANQANAQSGQIQLALQASEDRLAQAFRALTDAAKAGGNITGLLIPFNNATGLLSNAENAFRAGDEKVAADDANASFLIANQIITTAQTIKTNAETSAQTTLFLTLLLTTIGMVLLFLALAFAWRRLKRGYPITNGA
jgi:hypothetical protein